jgi:hypothetical protein
MPKAEREVKFIPREYWHLLTTNPPFGQIDEYGGKSVGEREEETETDDSYEEEVGIVEYHDRDGQFYAFAADMGVGLQYDGNGKLVNVNIDLLTYANFISFEHYEEIGGSTLSLMFDLMTEKADQLAIALDFRENDLALENFEIEKERSKTIFHKKGLDFTSVVPLKAKYGDYTLNFGAIVIEDVLHFGMLVTDSQGADDPETEVLMFTKVLNDCNYKTYWESMADDRAKKLTKRIFFVED